MTIGSTRIKNYAFSEYNLDISLPRDATTRLSV